MQPISQHELKGHIQRLREIFNRRFEVAHGDIYRLENVPILGPFIYLTLERNSCTIEAPSDRGQQDVCGVLATTQPKRILCSFFEAWRASGKAHFQFYTASMTFFLEFNEKRSLTTKQMFRLDWENWKIQEKQNKAAYPHWQFDHWLTASDMQAVERLRKSFKEPEAAVPEAEAMAFESAEQQLQPERPDLAWFTRVHFPSIAPWATKPISNNTEDADQSHRSVPASVKEIENWVDSALCYLRNEFTTYAAHA